MIAKLPPIPSRYASLVETNVALNIRESGKGASNGNIPFDVALPWSGFTSSAHKPASWPVVTSCSSKMCH